MIIPLCVGLCNAPPSNYWFSVGTNSPTFSRVNNGSDPRDFKLRCIVTDATNTTKTSNEFYVDVVSYPPEFSIVQNDGNKEQTISLVKEIDISSIPNSYFLDQNYPNPFNPSTKISYSLPEASFVTLKVFDMLGREIATLVNEAKSSGKYEVEFNASELPSGTYVYKLTAGNYQTNKNSNRTNVLIVNNFLRLLLRIYLATSKFALMIFGVFKRFTLPLASYISPFAVPQKIFSCR